MSANCHWVCGDVCRSLLSWELFCIVYYSSNVMALIGHKQKHVLGFPSALKRLCCELLCVWSRVCLCAQVIKAWLKAQGESEVNFSDMLSCSVCVCIALDEPGNAGILFLQSAFNNASILKHQEGKNYGTWIWTTTRYNLICASSNNKHSLAKQVVTIHKISFPIGRTKF